MIFLKYIFDPWLIEFIGMETAYNTELLKKSQKNMNTIFLQSNI